MNNTLTLNDRLVELGTLEDNKEQAIQRIGAEMVQGYLYSFEVGNVLDDAQLADLLYYLTDIQVRDYALGLLTTDEKYEHELALKYLLDEAPTDTAYINAPATLLAIHLYELHNPKEALLALSNAADDYSLAQLIHRVMISGWKPEMFGRMRADIHHQVVAGIFGEDN